MRRTSLAVGGIALAITLTGCDWGDKGALPGPKPAGGSNGTASLFSDARELANASKTKMSDAKTANISANIELAGQSANMDGQTRFDGDSSAISMNVNLAGQSVGTRLVDGAIYVKPPAGIVQIAGGKPWIKVPSIDKHPAAQMFAEVTKQLEKNDPIKTLEQIEQAGTITKSEQTNLDGQPASHYSFDIDLKKAAEQAANAGIAGEFAEQAAGAVDKVPVELWLNGDHLPSQVVLDLTNVAKAAGKPDAAGKITIKYSGWGAPVDVAAPPADQVGELGIPGVGDLPDVGDIPGMLGGLGSG